MSPTLPKTENKVNLNISDCIYYNIVPCPFYNNEQFIKMLNHVALSCFNLD